jgi:hypothetical protein
MVTIFKQYGETIELVEIKTAHKMVAISYLGGCCMQAWHGCSAHLRIPV